MILKCFALMYGDMDMQIPDAPRQTKPGQHMCREKARNHFGGGKKGRKKVHKECKTSYTHHSKFQKSMSLSGYRSDFLIEIFLL